jgi:hypothetical protein
MKLDMMLGVRIGCDHNGMKIAGCMSTCLYMPVPQCTVVLDLSLASGGTVRM